MARVAAVAPSTVSRALSRPGRVSYETAERVRAAAVEIGYRSSIIERDAPEQHASLLAMVVADVANPVFVGMIRGAERTAWHGGYSLLIIETQESEHRERDGLRRVLPAVDGTILTSSRMADSSIRAVAKQKPLVLLNRIVSQVPSVSSDNIQAIKRATEHLAAKGIQAITYLAGPEASWSDGMRWRGLREASLELNLKIHRIGPHLPTLHGGAEAAYAWLRRPTPGVIAYNDLIAIGFIRTVIAAGRRVPEDVSVIGFDNIVDGTLVTPQLTTIAAPLMSLGSAAVNHLLRGAARRRPDDVEPFQLPARLVIRDSTLNEIREPGN